MLALTLQNSRTPYLLRESVETVDVFGSDVQNSGWAHQVRVFEDHRVILAALPVVISARPQRVLNAGNVRVGDHIALLSPNADGLGHHATVYTITCEPYQDPVLVPVRFDTTEGSAQ